MQLFRDGIDDNPATVPYTTFYAAWSILFLCSWKRREKELSFLWGSEGFEANEQPQSKFKGQFKVNPETHTEVYVYANSNVRAAKNAISWLISLSFIFFTIVSAVLATLLKTRGEPFAEDTTLIEKQKWKLISSALNLIIIAVYGIIYELIAGGK